MRSTGISIVCQITYRLCVEQVDVQEMWNKFRTAAKLTALWDKVGVGY